MSVGMTDSKDQSKIELTSMTRVALSDPKRLAAAELCDNALANTIDLYHQVKQAHWTVKGPHFYARHELFDKLADRLRLYADDLAERCVMLGAVPHGTVRDAANRSTLKPYTAGMVDGMQHIRALCGAYETHSKRLRDSVDLLAKEQIDPATEDLFTEQLRGDEFDTWFLDSHLQS